MKTKTKKGELLVEESYICHFVINYMKPLTADLSILLKSKVTRK